MATQLVFALAALLAAAGPPAADAPPVVQFDLYKWQHRIGTETAYVTRDREGTEVRAAFAFSDRATAVPLAAVLQLAPDGSPRRFQLWGRTSRRSDADERVVVTGKKLVITQRGASRTAAAPARFFLASAYAPAIVTEQLLRYWASHGRPARLPVFPLGEVAIAARGADQVTDDQGQAVTLQRHSLEGLGWGRSTAWLDPQGALAAFKGTDTEFDHFEATRTGYSQALAGLVAEAARGAMAALVETSRGLSVRNQGVAVYLGGRLIDGTGKPPVADAAVVVEGGKVLAVGPRAQVAIPAGARTIELGGKTVLPGLWDMHAHFEQVEWGPVYLAAGVTTVRDCGNEPDFIRAVRDTVASGRGVGPRLLLACLVDGDGEMVIGNERLRTPEEIPALIKKLVGDGCDQVKIYSSLNPGLIAPLVQAAHQAGLTVTGHVPNGIGAVHAVEAGLDQINHISFIARALFPPGQDPDANLPRALVTKGLEELDVDSAAARATLAVFARRRTVVDPTVALYEMFTYPREEFLRREPGAALVAAPLRQVGSSPLPPDAQARAEKIFGNYLAVVRALHRAGVPIVAGTDQGVPGHSLHRELELYVAAGFTPMEAIQAATLVPARAMKRDGEVGTIEPGKRADLLVVDGDPLQDIRALRRITLVVAAGTEYDPARLWSSVGFEPPAVVTTSRKSP